LNYSIYFLNKVHVIFQSKQLMEKKRNRVPCGRFFLI